MMLVEFAEKTSPLTLTEWQKQLLAIYELAIKGNKRLLFVPPRISGRRIRIQIIREHEKEQAR